MRLRTQILLVITLPALLPMIFFFFPPLSQRDFGEEPPQAPPSVENSASSSPSPMVPRLVTIGSARYLVYRLSSPHEPRLGWLRLVFPLALYLILLFFVFLFFRRFDRSIVTLAKATRTIAQGDLDTPTIIRGNREIVVLAEALETMRQQLKEAKERKSFLLMGLSHDFRTPITAIKGYVEALEDGIALSPEEESSFLSIIHRKAVQLEGMVSRWLDLVRLETGERYMVFQNIKMSDYFQRLIRQFSLDARITNHDFVGSVEISSEWECPMDEELILRCFENLFYNAVQATPPGGKMGLRVYQAAEGILIDFWDNGTGIENEEKPLIWEPFFRGKAGKSQGTGLGLAVVKSILASHRWNIALVDSKAGALFRILVPRFHSAGQAAPKNSFL
jgi:signal transduction histidine kinase